MADEGNQTSDANICVGGQYQTGAVINGTTLLNDVLHSQKFRIFCGMDWPYGDNGHHNSSSMMSCINDCVTWNFNNGQTCKGIAWIPETNQCYNKKSMDWQGIETDKVNSALIDEDTVHTTYIFAHADSQSASSQPKGMGLDDEIQLAVGIPSLLLAGLGVYLAWKQYKKRLRRTI